ncbi:bifunctional YncE family protein/alkaline phosphatase family protein [Acidithiobacillus sp.]
MDEKSALQIAAMPQDRVVPTPTLLPTGQYITPQGIPGAQFHDHLMTHDAKPPIYARGAVSTLLTPDGHYLLILTSGFNRNVDTDRQPSRELSHQSVIVYDLSNPRLAKIAQIIPIKNTFCGMALSANGKTLYVGGGIDDNVAIFRKVDASGHWQADGQPIPLEHRSGLGLHVKPLTAGLALSPNGRRLLVSNFYNDSVSMIDLDQRRVLWEMDLRPGPAEGRHGQAGGESPFWIVMDHQQRAYISSMRDREIVVIATANDDPKIVARMATPGNPNRLLLDEPRHRLYAAMENRDSIAVIDTKKLHLQGQAGLVPVETFRARMPGFSPSKGNLGWSANALAISPDHQRLYATLGQMNAVAVLSLAGAMPHSLGLLPTAWSPQDLVYAPAGDTLWVINNKSVPGANPGYCSGYRHGCIASSPVQPKPNQYILQLSRSGLQEIPHLANVDLSQMTSVVLKNNHSHLLSRTDRQVMNFLHQHIRHVIYIVKENRSYDQVLGDLPRGNGDPSLTEFPLAVTPNQHRLALAFVLLDHFLDTGEVSGDGWAWSTAARESDINSKMLPNNYAEGGGSYDWEGTNRNVNVGLEGKERLAANPDNPKDPDLLPGTADVAAPDSDAGKYQQGYLWSAALRHGLTLRNYGFFVDLERYDTNTNRIPLSRHPYQDQIIQAYPANPELAAHTDPFFRSFDNAYPDYYRYREWEREFRNYEHNGKLPTLSLIRFMNDHTGKFAEAMDGVNTPELQVADNDYALGLLVERIAHSRYARDTLIFVVEDDAQDGPDHVDAHRSIAFVVGPYVRQGALVSTPYNTLNLLRTMEMVLGLRPLSGLDGAARPMTDIFDLRQKPWSFRACPSGMLQSTALASRWPANHRSCSGQSHLRPLHDWKYWAAKTRGMDFSAEDRIDTAQYNRILWEGIMHTPQPN